MNILKKWRIVSIVIFITTLILLGSCASITGPAYYSHMIAGEAKILVASTPISKLLADKTIPNELRRNLQHVQEMRDFAVYELGLPKTDSYTSYSDTGREFAAWVVTATPEFSVNPKMWCHPIAGCFSYLGFFDKDRAIQAQQTLIHQKYDVSIRGSVAYSTVGWFSDPVLNTVFRYSDASLAGTIFHEISHERVRINDDPTYRESFASFVGKMGQYLWMKKHNDGESAEKFLIKSERNLQFAKLLSKTRKELRSLYKKDIPEETMRRMKAETISKMRERYSELAKTWDGYPDYSTWIAGPHNNADIAGEDEYNSLIPFFQKLFDLSHQKFPAFYARAEAIANLPKIERYIEIEKIMAK